MAALQFVDDPKYAAIIFRRTYADLALPGALMDRAKEWLYHRAKWSHEKKSWEFPSGATLSFGYLDTEDDKYRYQGAEYQFIGFDELTQFSETQYRYLFSRLRRLEGSDTPIRMRAASNPGGIGHEWVKKRFIAPNNSGRVFVPARLHDNPHLDQQSYVKSLSELDPITRAQLLAGDWDAYEGGRFKREWFRTFTREGQRYKLLTPTGVMEANDAQTWKFITCDPAATEKDTSDYTAIGVFGLTVRRDLLVLEVVRERIPIDEIVPRIRSIVDRYRSPHPVRFVAIEASGFQWALVKEAQRSPDLPTIWPLEPGGKGKLVRATPAIIRASNGQIYLPERGEWIEDFVAELVQFTGDEKKDSHDDQVDMLAWAVQAIDRSGFIPEDPLTVEPGEKRSLRPQIESAAVRRGLFGRGR